MSAPSACEALCVALRRGALTRRAPRRLADADLLSKSDPCVQVYTRRSPLSEWAWVGKTGAARRRLRGRGGAVRALTRWALRTETVPNNLNPRFTTPVVVDFYFEEVTYVKFEARRPRRAATRRDCGSPGAAAKPGRPSPLPRARAQVLDVDKTLPNGHVSGDDLVRCRAAAAAAAPSDARPRATQGCMECRLSDIVGARGSTVLKPLVSKRSKQARPQRLCTGRALRSTDPPTAPQSLIKVSSEEASSCKGTVVFTMRGVKLANRCAAAGWLFAGWSN